MTRTEICSGVLLDEQALTIEEFACACAVEVEWVVERVQAGFIEPVAEAAPEWRFASRELARARHMLAAERMFDANQELAALMADLLEELQQLRRQLQARSAR
jgi:chaperone modulatory protein CbpM